MPESPENLSHTSLPQVDIFKEGGIEKVSVGHQNLENLTVDSNESAALYSKTKETAERLGLNDLFGQAGHRIDAVVKMLSYEDVLKDQTEVVHMDDTNIDKVYEHYKHNMQEVGPRIPELAKHYVLLETLQTQFKDSIENGKLVYFEDTDTENSRTKIRSDEAKDIAPLLEVMKVDYLVNSIRPGTLNPDYAAPLSRMQELMNGILTTEGPNKGELDRARVQEIFEQMVESLKFIGSQDPQASLSEVHSGIISSGRIIVADSIKYNPLDNNERYTVDPTKLERVRTISPEETHEILDHLDKVTPNEVFVPRTTYWPRQLIGRRETANYDIKEVGENDFKYYVKALVKINAAGLVPEKAKLDTDIDSLVSRNEGERGMLSRVGFIINSLTPSEGVSKGDLVRLAGAYVARTEITSLAQGSVIEKRRVPMLKKGDGTNPERQHFFDELDKLDGVFDKLFDNQVDEDEVTYAKEAIFRAVDAMRTAELRWTRANLTSENVPSEFPGVLSFVEEGADKLPWGRKLVSANGKAVIQGQNVADGFPIN